MSEFDQMKKEKQALIEARKLKQSTPDGGAGLLKVEGQAAIVPITFKQKWDNYWYHYKGRTFGVALLTILVVVFALEMIFKTVHDGKITIVAQYPLDAFSKNISSVLSKPEILTDITENEKLELDLAIMQIDQEGKYGSGPEVMQANVVKLSASVSSLDSFIFVLDQPSYDYLLGMEMTFMDLSDKVDKSHLENGKDKYSLKGTKIAEELDLGEIVDGLFICFFDYNSLSEKRQENKNVKKTYERDIVLFESILAYETDK